jgi:hypothetical protein
MDGIVNQPDQLNVFSRSNLMVDWRAWLFLTSGEIRVSIFYCLVTHLPCYSFALLPICLTGFLDCQSHNVIHRDETDARNLTSSGRHRFKHLAKVVAWRNVVAIGLAIAVSQICLAQVLLTSFGFND